MMLHAHILQTCSLMTDRLDDPPPIPANENHDPLGQADTALDEMYRIRSQVLGCDSNGLTFDQRLQRRRVLQKLDQAIRLCLSCL
jgi:hypothetical protein